MKLHKINDTTFEGLLRHARVEVGDRNRPEFIPCADVFNFEDETRFRVAYADRAYSMLTDDPTATEVDRVTLTEGVVYPAWQDATAYAVGDLCEYQGGLFECIQAHTSQNDWTPPVVPALWKVSTPPGTIGTWIQPTGAHDAYPLGAQVLHVGKVWQSLIAANVWEPGSVNSEALWQVTTGRVDVDCYLLEPTSQYEDGGFEFEVVMRGRPASNVVSMAIQTEGLNFYYQGELTPAEVAEGSIRPDNVVGSYAVYHATCGQIHAGPNMLKYRTGKAFHIFRPKAVDANGDWVWCDLHVDAAAGMLTIEVDGDWLDAAAYPVKVDPTFGVTTVGTSATSYNTTYIGAKATMPEDGTIRQVSVYATRDASFQLDVAIYSRTGTPANDDLLAEASSLFPSGSEGAARWHPMKITLAALADDPLWLVPVSYSYTFMVYWDNALEGECTASGGTFAGTFRDPLDLAYTGTKMLSMVAAYDTDTQFSRFATGQETSLRGTDATYLTAQQLTSADQDYGDGAQLNVGQSTGYNVFRAIVPFDLTDLNPNSTIQTAGMYLDGMADYSTTNFTMRMVEYTGGLPVDLDDFASFGTTSWGTRLSADYTSGWNQFTINSTGLAGLSTDAPFGIGVRSEEDINQSAPTNDEFCQFVGGTSGMQAYITGTLITEEPLVLTAEQSGANINLTMTRP